MGGILFTNLVGWMMKDEILGSADRVGGGVVSAVLCVVEREEMCISWFTTFALQDPSFEGRKSLRKPTSWPTLSAVRRHDSDKSRKKPEILVNHIIISMHNGETSSAGVLSFNLHANTKRYCAHYTSSQFPLAQKPNTHPQFQCNFGARLEDQAQDLIFSLLWVSNVDQQKYLWQTGILLSAE